MPEERSRCRRCGRRIWRGPLSGTWLHSGPLSESDHTPDPIHLPEAVPHPGRDGSEP